MTESQLRTSLLKLLDLASSPSRSAVALSNHMEGIEREFDRRTKRDARVLALLRKIEHEPLTEESRAELAALIRELEGEHHGQ